MPATVKLTRANTTTSTPFIAVGYRMNSYQAPQFRTWATKTLREFIFKSFAMDDKYCAGVGVPCAQERDDRLDAS